MKPLTVRHAVPAIFQYRQFAATAAEIDIDTLEDRLRNAGDGCARRGSLPDAVLWVDKAMKYI